MTIDIQASVLGTVLALLVLLAFVLAWRSTHDENSKFNFADLFVDPVTGKTSLSQLGQFAALAVSTWGFVYLTLAYKLTEWYFVLYMTIWAAANGYDKYLKSKAAATPADKPAKPEAD